jgi:Cellulose synthase operon protein C C-terminus (BCSC_C)
MLRAGVLSAVLVAAMLAPSPGMAQVDRDPSIYRPVSPDEIQRLRRQLTEETRSNVELNGDYHYESGDLNNRLDWFRGGARGTYKVTPGTRLYLSAVETRYLTQDDSYNGWGTNLTLGVASAISDSLRVQAELGGTYFSTDTTSINGLASIGFAPIDTINLYLTVSRSNVEESLLSATGLRPKLGPFAGELVGQVMDTRGVAGVAVKLPYKLDALAEGGYGVRDGSHVGSNSFGLARGVVGYEVIGGTTDKPLNFLRVSYQLNYFGFEDDRSGFGGASLLTADGRHTIQPPLLGSDGISPSPSAGNPGVGGYFSPQYYLSNTIRADLTGRPIEPLTYRASAFVGVQNYTDSSSQGVVGFAVLVDYALNDRFSIPVSFAFDNLGPYNQLTLSVRLVIKL